MELIFYSYRNCTFVLESVPEIYYFRRTCHPSQNPHELVLHLDCCDKCFTRNRQLQAEKTRNDALEARLVALEEKLNE